MVFSPVSVAVALGMTYAGARNNTAVEMAAAMQNDLADDAFHAAGNQLQIMLDGRNIAPYVPPDGEGEKSLQLSLVNAVWAQNEYLVEELFLDILAVNYDSGVKLLDFISDPESSRLTINDWVADNTNQKIEDLITEGAITSDTKLVLTNALYFYGSWRYNFEEEATREGTFNPLTSGTVLVDMMHQTYGFSYAEGTGYQMIDLPYDGGELAMTIVLPAAGSFAEIRDEISDAWLTQAREAMVPDTEVALTLPKFSFTWGSESLKDPLVTLGMVDAFSTTDADFTGINPSGLLYISDVLHKAFIGVDEYGTEAAAATAVIIADSSIPDEPVSFAADRPFLFFIRDASGLILFAGQVMDPSA